MNRLLNRLCTAAIACAGVIALSGVASAAHHESGHAPGGAAPEHRSDMGDANSNAQFGPAAERAEDRAAQRRDEHADEHEQGSSHPGAASPRGGHKSKGHADH